ncbi:Acetylcholinesterase [Dactylellina cionopaga]|nr:Acetylcholinesterase [Dactylellina cionopaga]
MGNPIIAVSINYRLSVFGWLGGREIAGSGNANLALRDQRLAFRWVQENIEAFGGDKSKVTLFGESAGSMSIIWHKLAYGGRDDGLFRGVVMQSGSSSYQPSRWPETYQPKFEALVNTTGCGEAIDRLDCLRSADVNLLYQVAGADNDRFDVMIDGDILSGYTSKQIEEGRFLRVPTIIGATSDEGAFFPPANPINTDAELKDLIGNTDYLGDRRLTNKMLNELLAIYDSSTSIPAPEKYAGTAVPLDKLGAQYFRTAAILGDFTMHAFRRFATQQHSAHNVPVWAYRFDAVPNGYKGYMGSTHTTEIPFVFNSRDQNWGDLLIKENPMGGPKRQQYVELADTMSKAWINFFVSGNPNGKNKAVYWPKYGENSGAQEMVFDIAPRGPFVGRDDYRSKGIEWIIGHRATLGR